ncbi:hypothetical protein [Halalkalibacillus sediminis]|uniref:hypothetical protein n=1 Tax=Halalkalibacillus sediminis TaxID=2018042 RepID=UPI00192E6300|nr:hypothetical protein [Halalkalibacillus sediminis]
MKCPNCQTSNLGKIGEQQYYCWTCLIEITVEEGQMHVHEIEEDGSVSSLDDLFFE